MVYLDNVLKIPQGLSGRPAQYMIRHKQKQYNLCGEFCIAYCLQDEAHTDNIDVFLDYWQAKDLKWYNRLFQKGLGRTTGLYDLEMILDDYGFTLPYGRFSDLKLVPDIVSQILDDFQVVLGVQINYTGRLVNKGIPHWVVLERVQAIDLEYAICDVYNPFKNNVRPYSWQELLVSAGAYKQGILIPRSVL